MHGDEELLSHAYKWQSGSNCKARRDRERTRFTSLTNSLQSTRTFHFFFLRNCQTTFFHVLSPLFSLLFLFSCLPEACFPCHDRTVFFPCGFHQFACLRNESTHILVLFFFFFVFFANFAKMSCACTNEDALCVQLCLLFVFSL